MKVAVIGNTKQTLKALKRLVKERYDVKLVFGLSIAEAENKVNYVDLNSYCHNNNIILEDSNNWEIFSDLDVDLVLLLGDSRIIPKDVLKKHKVIGNHGAVLPYVQGGASLVWGRMLGDGTWGISLMELNEIIDGGKILITKEFCYDSDCSMEEFVDKADDLTVDALFEYLNGSCKPESNSKWDIKINKYTDSSFARDILIKTLREKKNIYLPPRVPSDGLIDNKWGSDFIKKFKSANSYPYPRWYTEVNW